MGLLLHTAEDSAVSWTPLLQLEETDRNSGLLHVRCVGRVAITRILEEAGGSIDDVLDVTSFLVDMDRDFSGYNEVWAETLGKVGPTRTTLAIRALPTPIAVEMKVIAKAPPEN